MAGPGSYATSVGQAELDQEGPDHGPAGANREGRAHDMRGLFEITPDGDIIADDGEIHTLFSFDPESTIEDPLE